MKTTHSPTNTIYRSINNLLFFGKQRKRLQQCVHYTNFHSISSYHSSSNDSYFKDESSKNINIVQFIQLHGLQEMHDYKFRTYYQKNTQILQLKECPLCPPHKNDITNLWTLGIFINNGSWNCFRCQNSGNWSSLIKIFNIYGQQCGNNIDNYNDIICFENNDLIENESEENEIESIIRNDYISETEINAQNNALFNEQPLLNRLIKERNISSKCFKDYKCGLNYMYFTNIKQKQQCITFPMYKYNDKYNKFIATKYKTRCVSNNIKQFGQYPIYNDSGLFGFNLNGNNTNKVVITEGEYDSMAIYDATKYKIKPISLPQGANNIPKYLLDQLIQFYDTFLLFLDWDHVGQKNANILKDKIKNCANKKVNVEIVTNDDNNNELLNVKDANDILIKYDKGHDILKDIMDRYQME
eukprot:426154_1